MWYTEIQGKQIRFKFISLSFHQRQLTVFSLDITNTCMEAIVVIITYQCPEHDDVVVMKKIVNATSRVRTRVTSPPIATLLI